MEEKKREEEIKKALEEKRRQIYIAQKKKEKMINETLSKRDKSVQRASVQRDAVMLYNTFLETFGREPNEEEVEKMMEKIMEIKEWLMNIYEIERKCEFLALKELIKGYLKARPEEPDKLIEDEKPPF
ncbi:hypothetical protein J7L36_01870 [bacterium]|nr:hypothetical protein [bacterium]